MAGKPETSPCSVFCWPFSVYEKRYRILTAACERESNRTRRPGDQLEGEACTGVCGSRTHGGAERRDFAMLATV